MTRNLLPKSRYGFADKNYWDNFFSKRGSDAFEWYGEYTQLCSILHKYINFSDKLLVVGCGNSSVSPDLYDAGYHDNMNVDISEVVISQMAKRFSSGRPGLVFSKMDVAKMEYGDCEFNVVLDKGTLDALMPDESSSEKALSILGEIGRVLKVGGRYLCISLLQDHILRTILSWCTQQGWMLRIHRCLDVEETSRAKDRNMVFPVFAVVCTKMKKLTGMPMILEHIGFESESSATRVQSLEELTEAVCSTQQYCLLRQRLNTKKWIGEEICVDLCLSSSGVADPRYRVFVVDRRDRFPTKFAVFIVPQGRETDWMFGTEEGRTVLADNAKSQRLLVVHLDRSHAYDSLDQIKNELSPRVMEFTPLDYDPTDKVPFLSLGEDVGERTILHRGHNDTTGDYVVEDVKGEGGQFFRRLIFLNNPNVIQSEARLLPVSKKKKKSRMRVDPSYLACQHHKFMLLSTALTAAPLDGKVEALLVGLGGGGLPSFVLRHLAHMHLDVVEIDCQIVSIATKWFDLDVSSDRLTLLVQDGLQFVTDAAKNGKHYNLVLLDVDNKDSSSGLSVPPPAFLEKDFLNSIRTIISPNGIFVLNLVCRDTKLKNESYDRLRDVFPHVRSKKIPEEVNEVVYALSAEVEDPSQDALLARVRPLAEKFGDEVDLQDWLDALHVADDPVSPAGSKVKKCSAKR